jgi:hypothetical protein
MNEYNLNYAIRALEYLIEDIKDFKSFNYARGAIQMGYNLGVFSLKEKDEWDSKTVEALKKYL